MTFELRWADRLLHLGRRTHVMGVINVTPDSFSDGGLYFDPDRAVEHGLEMERDGADMIDIGGESTRPYSQKISSQEEKERVVPIIARLSSRLSIPISIDTRKADVAGAAIEPHAAGQRAHHFDRVVAAVAVDDDRF